MFCEGDSPVPSDSQHAMASRLRSADGVVGAVKARARLLVARFGRVRSLRSRMILLVFVSFLPAMGLSTLVVLAMTQRISTLRDSRQVDALRELAEGMDRWLETACRFAEVTAAAPIAMAWAAPILERSQVLAEDLGFRIVLRDRDGRIRLADGQQPADPEASSFAAALMTHPSGGKAWVADSLTFSSTGMPMPHVLAEIPAGGFVDVTLRPTRLRTLVALGHALEPTVTILSDANGEILASSDSALIRQRLPATFQPEITGPAFLVTRASWLDGLPHRVYYSHPLRARDWTISVWDPEDAAASSWRRPLLVWLAVLFASLLASIAVAASQTRRLLRPLDALTRNARITATGAETPLLPVPASPVREFEALRIGVARASAALRHRAERERQAVRQARDGQVLLASVINASADGITVTDRQGREVLANTAAIAILGEADSRPAGTEQAARLLALDCDVMASGQTRSTEIVTLPADGTSRQIWMIKSPWRDASDVVVGVVTLMRDVTEQRRDEARLHTLQAAQVEASLLSAMGVMAAGLAHDLNQPLAAASNFLGGAIQLLDPRHAQSEAASATGGSIARKAVIDASAQVRRAGEIVRALRAFLADGRIVPTDVAVADLLTDAAAMARADGSLGGVRLELAAVDPSLHVRVDATQMRQVLLNLLRNAAEAIQEASRSRGVVRLAASAAMAGRVAITVSDSGPGVPPDVIGRLFEPFVSTKRGGLGFGLAICRTLVDAHGGELHVGQADGDLQGAMFTIVLDVAGRDEGEVG